MLTESNQTPHRLTEDQAEQITVVGGLLPNHRLGTSRLAFMYSEQPYQKWNPTYAFEYPPGLGLSWHLRPGLHLEIY